MPPDIRNIEDYIEVNSVNISDIGHEKCDIVFSEDEVAGIFAQKHKNKLRYCNDAGAWYMWDGHAWRKNKPRIAFHCIRELTRDLTKRSDEKTRSTTGKASFSGGVEKFARADPVFAADAGNWDPNPYVLGTPDGTVDLRTGQMRAASPADGITKLAACAPLEQDDCPVWKQFLEQTTGCDQGMIRFLQQWCGYCLTGDTREHALIFIYGSGGNGKSIFLNVLTGILGDYAATAAIDTFMASSHDKHPTDLAMLKGARIVTASETEEGRAWAESRIKQMTGGDPITARFMRQDFFTYQPQFKLTIVGNHRPALRNVDDAIRRRLNIVAFTQKPTVPDHELDQKLWEEWPAILRWMINGCLDWQQHGLMRPASVNDATQSYFDDQDVFGQWLADCCQVRLDQPDIWEKTSDLFESWEGYARNADENPGSRRYFHSTMTRKGFESFRTKSARGFRGIKLVNASRHSLIGDG